MRGFGGFLAYRFFRTLVALWLVSTVVFVVMRLSGDPVPLLLPPGLSRRDRDLAIGIVVRSAVGVSAKGYAGVLTLSLVEALH